MAGSTSRLVLTFHGIGDVPRPLADGELDVWLSRKDFVATLDAAQTLGDVEITFDDGNASDYDIAFPELIRRGLGGTFFIVADWIDRPGFLSAGQMRDMTAAGMVIGSHGMHHVQWRGLPDRGLRAELVESREAIQGAAGQEVTLAACPFGAYDRHVVGATRRAGYRRLYTSDRGLARPGLFVQARSSLHRDRPADELQGLHEEPLAVRFVREARKLAKRWR